MNDITETYSSSHDGVIDTLVSGRVFGPERAAHDDWPVVTAATIRNLLRGTNEAISLDPRGVRLRHVHIAGRLDLDNIRTDIPLELHDCTVADGISAIGARLTVLRLKNLSISRDSLKEAILDLTNARLEFLDLTSSIFRNAIGPALVADGVVVEAGGLLDSFQALSGGDAAALRLIRATITNQLRLQRAILISKRGPALNADGLTLHGSAFFEDLKAYSGGKSASLRLVRATITGRLNLQTAILTSEGGPALLADGITVNGSAVLDQLVADSGAIDTHSDEDVALSTGINHTVTLVRATIRGQLSLQKAKLTSKNGSALTADGLTVKGSLLLNEIEATSGGQTATLELRGATITSQLSLGKAAVKAEYGPVLEIKSSSVGSNLSLDLIYSTDRQPPELSDKKELPKHSSRERFHPKAEAVNLSGTHVGKRLHISSRSLPTDPDQAAKVGSWDVVGLTYNALTESAQKIWLQFLCHGTSIYKPQPYRQFADTTRSDGEERLTRKALIAQHRDKRLRSTRTDGGLTFWGKMHSHLLEYTIGYGYQSVRALGWALGLFIIASAVTFAVGHNIILADSLTIHGLNTGTDADACGNLDLGLLSLNVIPLITLAEGISTSCSPTDSLGGYIYFAFSMICRLFGWALLALFIAGYTNIIRDPYF